jgi:dolichyl-phosphate-mannose-protein mannosyltransferase
MDEDWEKIGLTATDGEVDVKEKAVPTTIETAGPPEAVAASNQRFVLTLWWSVLFALVAATAATRFYDLEGSSVVCWDEAHFGKFATWYLNRTHFFDVHPPLGKMIIAGFGKASGYQGSFNFSEPGISFAEHSGIVGMRLGCAALGACTLPVAFLTAWEMTGSLSAATLAGMLLLFDTGFAVINRYILLDPIMIFFISFSFYSMVRFRNLADKSFSSDWWRWLTILGVSLAGTISVKFVGLFIVLYVGCFTALDLWNILGDVSKGCNNFIKHFLARAACLIALPFIVYFSIFCLHFWALRDSGPGDGYHSSLFQATFAGSEMSQAVAPAVTSYGERVSLRASHNMPCGYLHSHQDLYPAGVGARQQMVTSYLHRDPNNLFTVKRNFTGPEVGEPGPVRSGDLVVLEHWPTGRNLHSHKIPSVMAKSHYQVTGYGEEGIGDENDLWRVEVEGAAEGAPVRPLLDRVRLRHHHLQCLLTCTSEQLPKDWSFGQIEVTCSPWQRQTKEARGFTHAVWTVEESVGGEAARPVKDIAPGLWGKFVEAHRMMVYVNKNMGTQAKQDELDLQAPWKWPLNLATQKYSPTGKKIVMLGSPAVWWTNLACLVLCPLTLLARLFLSQRPRRGAKLQPEGERETLTACATVLGAWALHYLPFFMMYRILYIHHYYPAVYFSSLLTAIFLDHLARRAIRRLPDQLQPLFLLSFLVAASSILAYVFNLFSPLVYGHTEEDVQFENSTLHHLFWVEQWNF